MSIHESFLMHGIGEILINSIKYTPNQDVLIDIQVVKEETKTLLRFVHSEMGETEITPEIVKIIFESFCGNSNVVFYNDKNKNYNIEISFNTELLKLV
ncbi:MAG: ATP-binding protein [Saprospiraceae bacterium]|nr:ATP-binding protein [Saprospiraceae bacterium]